MNWLSLLGTGFSIFTAIINVVVLLAMKFNDLRHVQKDLTEIKDELKEHSTKIVSIAEDVAHLKGKLCNKRKR